MANSVEQLNSGVSQPSQASAGKRTDSSTETGKFLPAPAGDFKLTGKVGLLEAGKPEAEVADLDEAIARIQDYFQDTRRSLEFRLDETTGITVVSVFDTATQELIRQIPSEEAVNLARKLNQEEPLSLFRAQV